MTGVSIILEEQTIDVDSRIGKVGEDSSAAQFASATSSGFAIEKEKPYAEVEYTTEAI